MTSPELATKAPESDLHSPNPSSSTTTIPGDTPAQTGPTTGMSSHCTTDRPLPADQTHQPAGDMTTLNSIPCYITKPPSYPHSPSKLLLLLTGGTGIHSTNNKLQADAFAARGFLVVMPDQFNGDPAPSTATTAPLAEAQGTSQPEPTLLERVKMGAAETAKSFVLDMWLARHDVDAVVPILQKVLEGAREEFADAVANGGGVYGAGYCFGAKYILVLCGEQQQQRVASGEDVEKGEARKGPELKVGAIAHGTLVTKEDLEGVRSPVAMACVEGDALFRDDVREQGKASLELNAVKHDIRVYTGVPHGFAVLGDYAEERIMERQKEAFEMMCGWLEEN